MEDFTALLRRDPERALEKMLSAYAGLVYSAAAAILGRDAKEEIEECVSDAFLAVYHNRRSLDFTKGSLKAYLCAAARNLAVNRLRQRQKNKVVPLDEFLPAKERTETAAIAHIEGDALIEQVLSLGEPDSTIVICRYYFGMRTKEIAHRVGMKENTVDQRLRRALKKLRGPQKGELFHAE